MEIKVMRKTEKIEYSDDVYRSIINLKKEQSPKKYLVFRKLIEMETGHKILPASKELINHVDSIVKSFINQLPKELSGKSHSGVGWDMEAKFRKYAKFRSPKGTGYPDMEGDFSDSLFYLENKGCNETSMNDTVRTFYYSSSSRIKQDAPHLLIAFEYKKTSKGKIWTDKYHIVDLYDKKMSLRVEVNNNGYGNKHMFELDLI
jgi:hypothetical protein